MTSQRWDIIINLNSGESLWYRSLFDLLVEIALSIYLPAKGILISVKLCKNLISHLHSLLEFIINRQ
jgi:hypothetical protein